MTDHRDHGDQCPRDQHGATVEERALKAARALENCDWSGVPIGNKILISGAIELLRQGEADRARVVEWRCFHCGEAFTDESCARKHFGPDEGSVVACVIKAGSERGLLGALRKAETELADAWHAIHSESTDAAKAYYAQMSRHQEQMRLCEENAYERGLGDGRELAEAHLAEVTKERDEVAKWAAVQHAAADRYAEQLTAAQQSLRTARGALELARPIVEADHEAAKESRDADWEGLSFTALESIDKALATLSQPDDGEEGR